MFVYLFNFFLPKSFSTSRALCFFHCNIVFFDCHRFICRFVFVFPRAVLAVRGRGAPFRMVNEGNAAKVTRKNAAGIKNRTAHMRHRGASLPVSRFAVQPASGEPAAHGLVVELEARVGRGKAEQAAHHAREHHLRRRESRSAASRVRGCWVSFLCMVS